MTTTTLPETPADGLLRHLGQLADLLLKPFTWALQPGLRKTRQLLEQATTDFAPQILTAEDEDDVSHLVEEVALSIPFAKWLNELYSVRCALPELDRESTMDMARAFLSPVDETMRLNTGMLLWAHARLHAHIDFDAMTQRLPNPWSAARDLACPNELADVLTSGLRLEATATALLKRIMDPASAPDWTVSALGSEMDRQLRQILSLYGNFVDDTGREILRTTGVEPAPLNDWLAAYDAFEQVIEEQVEAAKAGQVYPFAS